MATFEIIMLTALYLFAFSYMANSFALSEGHNTRMDRFLIILAAATFGVIWFPLIFAGDIWEKLNS